MVALKNTLTDKIYTRLELRWGFEERKFNKNAEFSVLVCHMKLPLKVKFVRIKVNKKLRTLKERTISPWTFFFTTRCAVTLKKGSLLAIYKLRREEKRRHTYVPSEEVLFYHEGLNGDDDKITQEEGSSSKEETKTLRVLETSKKKGKKGRGRKKKNA